MRRISRREFLERSILGAAGGAISIPVAAAERKRPPSGSDLVALGRSGLRVSRLSFGTGTRGGSVQRKLGVEGLAHLLRHGYDQGVRWWDTADAYGTHPHVREALKGVPREKITITSKTRARDGSAALRDIERFRKELGTDYIDLLLLHAMTEPEWPKRMQGPMEALEEAKQKGLIRAHGVSCHSVNGLKGALDPWVDVVLVRVNPRGVNMDGDPEVVVPIVRELHRAGKGIYGMKILGEGELAKERDACLSFTLGLECVDAFVIGFKSDAEVDDTLKRIPQTAFV